MIDIDFMVHVKCAEKPCANDDVIIIFGNTSVHDLVFLFCSSDIEHVAESTAEDVLAKVDQMFEDDTSPEEIYQFLMSKRAKVS